LSGHRRRTQVPLLQDRMRRPTHLGVMEDADARGAVGNPACGDVVTLYLRIRDGRIEDASFESIGSAYQLATASVLCDCVSGNTVAEARARGPDCVLKRLPDLPRRFHYLAHLAVDALALALDDWEHGRGEAAPVEAADDGAAREFVDRLLQEGGRWSTLEVEAMARGGGVPLPPPPVRFLSTLRREGRIQGEMDVARRSWVWWA